MMNKIWPYGKKNTLARVMNQLGSISFVQKLQNSSLIAFNYHRISANPKVITDFDSCVYGPDAETFYNQLCILKTNADPISEQDLINHIRGKVRLPKRAVLVTFDDGYRDNYEVALPIMKMLNIPGIFFVPTRSIDERELGWWDLISWYLKRTQKKRIFLSGEAYEINKKTFNSVKEIFFEKFKTLKAVETERLLAELSFATGVQAPSKGLQGAELMTWEQIINAHKQGIGIGSHTHSHRVLSTISLEEQKKEMIISKQMIEAKLGTKVQSLAIPVGGYEHFHRETPEIAKEMGYSLVYSFHTGINYSNQINPLNIKRVAPSDHLPLFEASLNIPSLFARKACKLNSPLSIRQNQAIF